MHKPSVQFKELLTIKVCQLIFIYWFPTVFHPIVSPNSLVTTEKARCEMMGSNVNYSFKVGGTHAFPAVGSSLISLDS
jgi:hypothetical protein